MDRYKAMCVAVVGFLGFVCSVFALLGALRFQNGMAIRVAVMSILLDFIALSVTLDLLDGNGKGGMHV